MKVKSLANFAFDTTVLRAERGTNGEMYLLGCASSDSMDYFETIFSQECQLGFVEDCQNSNIIIELFHNENNPARFLTYVGKVIEASVEFNEDEQKTLFMVKIELNKSNPFSEWIFQVIQNPQTQYGEPIKLGLSIHGTVKKWHYKYINNKRIRVFDRVILTHIAITDKPANKDTFLEAVSRSADSINEGEEMEEEMSTMSITSFVNQMIDALKALSETQLNDEDKKYTIKELVEKYHETLKEMCGEKEEDEEKGMEMISEEQCKRDENSQNNFSDNTNVKESELSMTEVNENETSAEVSTENIESVSREENENVESTQPNAESTSSEAGCNADNTSTTSSESDRQFQNQSINQEVISREKEMEAINNTIAEQLEKVSRDLISAFESKMSSLTSKIEELMTENKELSEQLEKVSRDIEVVKKQPSSTPANLVGTVETVSRSVDKVKRYKSGEMSAKEKEEYQADVLARFYGIK